MQLISQIIIFYMLFSAYFQAVFALMSDSFIFYEFISIGLQVPKWKEKTVKRQNSHLQSIKFTRLSKICIATWLCNIETLLGWISKTFGSLCFHKDKVIHSQSNMSLNADIMFIFWLSYYFKKPWTELQ